MIIIIFTAIKVIPCYPSQYHVNQREGGGCKLLPSPYLGAACNFSLSIIVSRQSVFFR